MNIAFDKPLWAGAKGRNGWTHTQGLSITSVTWDDTPGVKLEPVSSRGTTGSCVLIIPISAVPSLIEQLRTVVETA